MSYEARKHEHQRLSKSADHSDIATRREVAPGKRTLAMKMRMLGSTQQPGQPKPQAAEDAEQAREPAAKAKDGLDVDGLPSWITDGEEPQASARAWMSTAMRPDVFAEPMPGTLGSKAEKPKPAQTQQSEAPEPSQPKPAQTQQSEAPQPSRYVDYLKYWIDIQEMPKGMTASKFFEQHRWHLNQELRRVFAADSPDFDVSVELAESARAPVQQGQTSENKPASAGEKQAKHGKPGGQRKQSELTFQIKITPHHGRDKGKQLTQGELTFRFDELKSGSSKDGKGSSKRFYAIVHAPVDSFLISFAGDPARMHKLRSLMASMITFVNSHWGKARNTVEYQKLWIDYRRF